MPLKMFEECEDIGLEISRFYDRNKFPYRWGFVYLHGEIENEPFGSDIDPDMFFANIDKPSREGDFSTTLRSRNDGVDYDRKVIIKLSTREELTHLTGRGAFIYDADAMKHVMKPQDWR